MMYAEALSRFVRAARSYMRMMVKYNGDHARISARDTKNWWKELSDAEYRLIELRTDHPLATEMALSQWSSICKDATVEEAAWEAREARAVLENVIPSTLSKWGEDRYRDIKRREMAAWYKDHPCEDYDLWLERNSSQD